MKIAILDDYQNVALTMADWSRVESKAEITVFTDHVGEPDAVVARLQPFDVVCVMRERTPLPRGVLERLPRLKVIASTGSGNASIDMQAAEEHHIQVTATGLEIDPTFETSQTDAQGGGSARPLRLKSSSQKNPSQYCDTALMRHTFRNECTEANFGGSLTRFCGRFLCGS